ncbi:MAG TPA: hypothetical protein VIY86_11320 [Pirellulaceae bacterium]
MSWRIRPGKTWLVGLAGWAGSIGFSSRLWAQEALPVEESKEAWVVSYALVMLCVALGIFIITRSGKRDKGP